MRNYLVQAIQSLRPGSEFIILNNDYSTIQWVVLDGDAPTQQQVDAEIENIKLSDEQAVINRANRRAELLNKLGITEEEAKLLLGGN